MITFLNSHPAEHFFWRSSFVMLKPGHVQTGKWSSPSLFGKCHNDRVARCHFRPPPFFACVLQEHVWRWSSTNTNTHTWRGSWGLSAKGKRNLHVIRLVWSRYFSVCWKTKLLKRCWSIAVRFRNAGYITMCHIYKSTNKIFLLNFVFALLTFGPVFNGCVTVSLKKKAKPNNLHVWFPIKYISWQTLWWPPRVHVHHLS